VSEPVPITQKLALVTGASRGIGRAISNALLEAGARVVCLARTFQDRIITAQGRETDIRCDVTDPAAVERALTWVRAEQGLPDIVVNNAGVFLVKPVGDTTPAEFAAVLSANLSAPFFVARTLVPDLLRRGRGDLVTIGSIADHVTFPDSTAYAASKFGVRGLHQALAAELAGSGVRTTLVSPGPVDTELWDPIDPDSRSGFTRRRDMLQASDVARAVLFAVTQPFGVDISEIRIMPSGRRGS